MKRSILLAAIAGMFSATVNCQQAAPVARLQRSLFNGKDLSGWHVDVPADSNVRVRNPFVVRNGMLVSLGEPRGHLISDSSYRDYRLEVEYRFPATPGNAGVLVHASTPRALYKMFPRSIEVQMEHGNAGDFWCILEDIRVPDMQRRRGPPAEWGTTEGKARRILNLTDSSERPVGQWNRMVIEAVGRSIRVWVNGDLVNDGSKATANHGRIALQSEGSEVEFRKLSLTSITRLTQTPSIVGSWHGTSTCVDKVHFPACNDEEVIYDVRARSGTADTVDLRADKVVNGVREFMGELVFGRRGDGSWSSVFKNTRVTIRFELSVNGTAMTGRILDVPSERIIRRISLRRLGGA